MSYIEFLEASARISEKKCLLPYGATVNINDYYRKIYHTIKDKCCLFI